MSDIRRTISTQLPDSIKLDDEPVFTEPWQAQAFSMAVHLIESGVFSWPEWAETIGDEIAHAKENGIADDGSEYYQLWLRALERLTTEKQLASVEELKTTKSAWHDAYATTPHGDPVTLPESVG